MNDAPNAKYVVPPHEDPKLVAKEKPDINLAEDKDSFQHWRKYFKLEGYEIYL